MKQFLFSVMFLSGMYAASAQTTTNQPAHVVAQSNAGIATPAQALLPIEIIDITATTTQTNGIVAWGTSHSYRVANFVVERSFDGKGFTTLQTIPVTGDDINYSYTDAGVWNIAPNKVWYRLKTVETNGDISYSAIVELTAKP